MKKFKEIYLTKADANILRKICKGCQFFRPEKLVKDICSAIGWYNTKNIDEVIKYVKKCPCNQKCLVKASCREEQCPMWLDYIHKAVEERNAKLMGKT